MKTTKKAMKVLPASAGARFETGAKVPKPTSRIKKMDKTEDSPLVSASMVGFVPTNKSLEAKTFYETKLGLKFVEDDGFALVFKSGTLTIRVVRVGEFKPVGFTILGWEVDDVPESVAVMGKRGITFERYPFLEQDDLGIWTAPGGARVAWFRDPDGNILSVSSH